MDQAEAVAFCERLFAPVARRPQAHVERRAPARLGDLDPFPARRVQALDPLERQAFRSS
jgi:hypothetical protein